MGRELAVITGASSGIGAVFAQRLAKHYDLLLIARRKDRLVDLAAQLRAKYGCAVQCLCVDLGEDRGLIEVLDRIRSERNLGVLVNNAGFGVRGLFWESDAAIQDKMQRVHIIATQQLSHAALTKLVPRNTGGIINVASISAFAARPSNAAYSSTKAWTVAFSKGIHMDLKSVKSSVRVQALCPGFTSTEFHKTIGIQRHRFAPSSLVLSPEFVVDRSLKGFARGELIVVPGWQYKFLAFLASLMPL